MSDHKHKPLVRVFAATVAAAGVLGFGAACDEAEREDGGGTEQEQERENEQGGDGGAY